jgi:predicted RNA methylase
MTQLAIPFDLPQPSVLHAEVIEQADREISKLLLPASMTPPADACAPSPLAERCREKPRDLGDRLMEGLDLAVRRAEEAEAEIRQLHAEVLGCSVDELDDRLAADKAEEDRLRQEARASQPARAPKGKAAKGGDAIGIGRAALSERQRELLALVKVENNLAVYTGTERIADWDLLKRIMLALGGTWKTGGKKAPGGFRFPEDLDAAELVRLAQETGEITDPKAAELFETPLALGALAVERLEVSADMRVLEPSAGRGAIVRALLTAQPDMRIECIEALRENVAFLESGKGPRPMLKGGFVNVLRADFLNVNPWDDEPGAGFDRVLMNPPFSKRQDIKHVRHAFEFLRGGGVLVAIMSAGVKYRDDKTGREFRAFVEANQGEIWDNPDGSFIESGTGVRTVMVRVRKGGS